MTAEGEGVWGRSAVMIVTGDSRFLTGPSAPFGMTGLLLSLVIPIRNDRGLIKSCHSELGRRPGEESAGAFSATPATRDSPGLDKFYMARQPPDAI